MNVRPGLPRSWITRTWQRRFHTLSYVMSFARLISILTIYDINNPLRVRWFRKISLHKEISCFINVIYVWQQICSKAEITTDGNSVINKWQVNNNNWIRTRSENNNYEAKFEYIKIHLDLRPTCTVNTSRAPFSSFLFFSFLLYFPFFFRFVFIIRAI